MQYEVVNVLKIYEYIYNNGRPCLCNLVQTREDVWENSNVYVN